MSYLLWALLALGAYTFVAPLMSLATTGQTRIPSDTASLYANVVVVLANLAVVVYVNQNAAEYLTHPKAVYVYAAGLCVAVGVIAFYRGLSLGPVSVVTPIFGLFLVTSSVVGVVLLNEALTARKVAGIALAIVAVYLVSS
ncbi:MAG: EamA family transporter [Halobacteriota archaeon]